MDLMEIFTPYMSFILTFIIVLVNVLLLFFKGQWWSYLIANVLIIMIFGFLGLTTDTDILGTFVNELIGILAKIFTGLIDVLATMIQKIFEPLTSCSLNV